MTHKNKSEDKHNLCNTREYHREFWVFSGNRAWGIKQAQTLITNSPEQVWITNQPVSEPGIQILPSKAASLLGTESDVLVYDAYAGFNVDALGITSGIVRGGGKIILITPDFDQWPTWQDPENLRLFSTLKLTAPSRFLRRTIDILLSERTVHLIREDIDQLRKNQLNNTVQSSLPIQLSDKKFLSAYGAITHDQHTAINIIVDALNKKSQQSIVLTSHRGRGKSATLGLTAAWLFNTTPKSLTLLVTAPRMHAVTPIFAHAKQQLVALTHKKEDTNTFIHHANKFTCHKGTLEFIAPDALTLSQPKADILFVDEAAAMPVPLLEKWLDNYPKIIFSSTIHGYEGTGRGFAIRFKDILKRKRPKTQFQHLNTPARWGNNDPAEQIIFKLLALNSAPASDQAANTAYSSGFCYKVLTQEALLQHPVLLEQIFGLLVLSHYQTRPSDFRQLLDAPNISIHVLINTGQSLIIGVALIFYEGSIPSELHTDILLGKRRLRGQLLPQVLANQNHSKDALSTKGARVQRIAIHPVLHGKGLGSLLLTKALHTLKEENIDYIGSNFGMTSELLGFWYKNNFKLTGVGSQRDASSACHAATVIQGLSASGKEIEENAHTMFSEHLPHQLKEPLKNLEASICTALLQKVGTPSVAYLQALDKQVVSAYAEGYRLYDYALSSLIRFSWHILPHINNKDLLTDKEKELLILKIMQGQPWKICIERMKLTGKKEAHSLLRQCFKKLNRQLL